MSEAVAGRVIQSLASSQRIPAEQIALNTTFEELGMTSLDALALIADLEEDFNISIPNEDAMGLRTVRDAVECVQRLLPGEFASGEGAGQAAS
ncbi:MAG TPA: acyl carrier protein [Pyrinomonadaceae bacterium]|jgi:acyl carrier protein